MFFKRGFTLVELMIVMAIIGILAAAIYPAIARYLASARDVNRMTQIRTIAGIFQVYRNVNEVLPDNSSGAMTTYCVSDIFSWSNGAGRDRQYEELTSNISNIPIDKTAMVPIYPCSQLGSYMYNRLIDSSSSQYGVFAARMETNNNITYLTGSDFTGTTNLVQILQTTKMTDIDILTLTGNLAPIYHQIVY